MLTPKRIQELAEPIEQIYTEIVNRLLVNIGKHITSPTWTHTAKWEIQKLSELGQLTRENAAIINREIKKLPQTMRITMEATRRAALEQIEHDLDMAASEGHIAPPETDSTVLALRDYLAQATDKLNMVNTTMLESSKQQFLKAIQIVVDEEQQAAVRKAYDKRSKRTQEVLNEAAGSVAVGAETRTQALGRAIQTIAREGLTGFYDRAGRSWSPEAYVNMDIRTTVHNVAIEATKARMSDYGVNVFQISSHAGARPRCYPYQGKFYSWDNTSGEVELGNGRKVRYEPITASSYGEPAGIFGVNCGHYPIPVVPGVTIPHGADAIQPKEENDKLYAESQEQRALERKIRAKKRVVEMKGDTVTEADKAAVKAAQAQMREFIKETGRTRRYDREKLY